MNYNNFRTRAISIREANLILEILKNYGIRIIYIGLNECYDEVKIKKENFNYSQYAILKENDTSFWIETKYYEWQYKPTRYVCWLDDKKRTTISGLNAFNEFQRWCFKAPHVSKYNNPNIDKYWSGELRKYTCSASPIIGYKPEYELKELYDIYEYDINSAYSSIMLDKIPDLMHPYFNVALKKNQVGFFLDDKLTMIKAEFAYVQVAFDLIELEPNQKKYIEKLYFKKEMAVDDVAYNEAKLMANAAIGYYQKWNPFLRSYIVNECNTRIKALIDDETVLWNTDAIFSLKRRPELPLGNEIGQFKEIHINRFVYKGNNYQIDFEKPKYRGVASSWFPDGWNMVTDAVPKRDNKYLFDQENIKLVMNKEH